MQLSDILASTDARKARWGIKRASAYVSGFSGCLDGGACPASLLGVSGDQWAKCLKEAELAAVYANPSMVVKDTSESDLPDGAVLMFDCIITSTRKDRDGDVLESSGCLLDQRMPLLWQHLSIQPIGKFVQETKRSKSFVGGRFAIADTPLGRDAAVLVKFGALRISHGFMPIEFEPLSEKADEGWRVRKFETYEASTVSIPSNVDAVILASYEKSKAFAQELDGIRNAYGRGLLETDAVKQWSKRFYENRPVQGKGIELPAKTPEPCQCQKEKPVASDATVTVKLDADDLIKALEHTSDSVAKAADKPCKCPECGHKGPQSEFAMDDDDDDKAVSLEQRCFAELLRNHDGMRAFRDRLNVVLEANRPQEWACADAVDELLAATV